MDEGGDLDEIRRRRDWREGWWENEAEVAVVEREWSAKLSIAGD